MNHHSECFLDHENNIQHIYVTVDNTKMRREAGIFLFSIILR